MGVNKPILQFSQDFHDHFSEASSFQRMNSVKNRVLIADDDENIRTIFTIILEQEGWEVNQATDGKEALEKVLQWQPNLLILDYQMPKLTGAEVYQHLQLHDINLAVVLISSYTDLEKLASSLGIVYYLPKPCDIPDFIKIINLACGKLVYSG